MKKTFIGLMCFVLLLSGCLTIEGKSSESSFYENFDGKPDGKPKPKPNPGKENFSITIILPISNDKKIDLKQGTYNGNLVIDQNKVRIKGHGPNKTIINGSVYINGNDNELKDVVIMGDLIIYGNNNDIKSVTVYGSTKNFGKGNNF